MGKDVGNLIHYYRGGIEVMLVACTSSIERKRKIKAKIFGAIKNNAYLCTIPKLKSSPRLKETYLPFAWWWYLKRPHGYSLSRGHLNRGLFYFLKVLEYERKEEQGHALSPPCTLS